MMNPLPGLMLLIGFIGRFVNRVKIKRARLFNAFMEKALHGKNLKDR